MIFRVLLLNQLKSLFASALYFLEYNGASGGQVALEAVQVVGSIFSFVDVIDVRSAVAAEFTVIRRENDAVFTGFINGYKIAFKGRTGIEVKDKDAVSLGVDKYLVVLMQPLELGLFAHQVVLFQQLDHCRVKGV